MPEFRFGLLHQMFFGFCNDIHKKRDLDVQIVFENKLDVNNVDILNTGNVILLSIYT